MVGLQSIICGRCTWKVHTCRLMFHDSITVSDIAHTGWFLRLDSKIRIKEYNHGENILCIHIRL